MSDPGFQLPGDPPANWQELAPTLPAEGILAGLSEKSLTNLAAFGHFQSLAPGANLITEGETQDRFYVVVAGRLAIFASASGQEVQLGLAEAGECLGEVSLLEPGPASASVKVLEDSLVWSMNLDDLRVYISEHAGGGGALLMGMAQCLSQRIRQSNVLIGQNHVAPLEILPAGRSRAITAENTPINLGFFDRIKKSFHTDTKIKLPQNIKM